MKILAYHSLLLLYVYYASAAIVYHDRSIKNLAKSTPHIIYTHADHQNDIPSTYKCITNPQDASAILCGPRDFGATTRGQGDRLLYNDYIFLFKAPPAEQPINSAWYAYDLLADKESFSDGLSVFKRDSKVVADKNSVSVVDPERLLGMDRVVVVAEQAGGRRTRRVMGPWELEMAKRVAIVMSLFSMAAILWWLVYGRRPRASFVF